MWAGKQQEIMQYHCQTGTNMEGERVMSTLSPIALDLLLEPYVSRVQPEAREEGDLPL